jgi:proline iminopeptidase
MRKIFLLCFVVAGFVTKAQTIFANAFGDPKNPAIVFLHDGPGYNPVSFELGCANNLADAGYYVITFDQRGCGRSKKDSIPDHYKFNKANEDINTMMKKYNVEQAFFIGNGWGGTSAIKYAELYPEKVKGLVLVSSPMDYQLMYKSILENCNEKFESKKDEAGLKKIAAIRKMDTTQLEYSSACMELAMANGLYDPKKSSTERDGVWDEMKKSKKFPYVSNMTAHPVYGFFMNERYTTIDMNYYTKKVIDKKIPVYGIYGNDDGLFNEKHFSMIKKTLGDANVMVVDDASHYVFLDQRTTFVNQVKKWLVPPPATTEDKKKTKK